MKQCEAVESIADRIPECLRELRGKATLSQMCRVMGIEEVVCPACEGTGWGDPEVLHPCPVCRGFREVPEALASWVQEQLRAAENGSSTPPRGVLNGRGSGRSRRRLGRTVRVAHRMDADAFQIIQN